MQIISIEFTKHKTRNKLSEYNQTWNGNCSYIFNESKLRAAKLKKVKKLYICTVHIWGSYTLAEACYFTRFSI